ncbi:MAG: hypothetical protein WAM60_08665 [Candidatus Promineifilaceae bacterium]
MTVQTEPVKNQKRGCRGCLPKLIIPVVLLALCAGCLVFSPLLLRALGLLPLSPAELYAGAPDPVAGALIDEILLTSGIEGSRTYVLPIKGKDKQLAVVTLGDATRFNAVGSLNDESVIMRTISGLARINDSGANIERTVVTFRDKDNELLFAFTVNQNDLEMFARGETTRSEFITKVDADLSGLLDVNRLQNLATSAEVEDLPEIGQADAEFVAGAAVEWAVGKNLITVNCQPPYDSPDCAPSVNAAEVARFQASQNDLLGFGLGLVGARSIDQEAATALGAAKVAADLAEADDLAEQGLAERNTDKFERALALRPGDWSLRDKQAAFQYAQGDADAAAKSLKEAEDLVNDQIKAGGNCLMLQQNLLRNREAAFSHAAELNPNNRSITDQLTQTQSTLTTLESGQPPTGLCP